MIGDNKIMKRLLTIIFVSIFSMSLLASCGSDDTSTDNGALEETTDSDTETAETGGSGDGNDGAEEMTRTIDKRDDEGWKFEAGKNLTIPEEFPSDYPKLDNYKIGRASCRERMSVRVLVE